MKARPYFRLTANVHGESAEVIGTHILSRPHLAGLQGPTVSPVINLDQPDWYAVSLLVPRERLLEAVDHLRNSGATDISASQVSYLFKDECGSFRSLLESDDA
jgi:ATP phosphoribosyltransferase